MPVITRRRFLQSVALAALHSLVPAAELQPAIGLGFNTYGMKSLSAEKALRAIAEIGYDGVELCLMPGWPTEPGRLTSSSRRAIRAMLGDLGLALPALAESLTLTGTPQARVQNLDRLKRAAALARELAPANPPLIETVLGLKPADWDTARDRMADELRDWARIAADAGVLVCIKPHAGQAVHTPERARWLLREVASPNLRLVYDYSHYSLQGLSLADTLKALLPDTRYIHVKDARVNPAGKPEYLLPGEGNIDYAQYFRLLKEYGYRGFVAVEVSAMIHGKPGYDSVSTAKLCYDRLAPAFVKAGVSRPEMDA